MVKCIVKWMKVLGKNMFQFLKVLEFQGLHFWARGIEWGHDDTRLPQGWGCEGLPVVSN